MLLRIRIQNFLSFQKETSFDMLTDPKIEGLPHHISKDTPLPLLSKPLSTELMALGKAILSKPLFFLRTGVPTPNVWKK